MKSLYEECEGFEVHLGFRVQHKDLSPDTDRDTAILSLIKQVTFSEEFIAKTNGRELHFKPAIIKPGDTSTEVLIDGVLGGFIEQNQDE